MILSQTNFQNNKKLQSENNFFIKELLNTSTSASINLNHKAEICWKVPCVAQMLPNNDIVEKYIPQKKELNFLQKQALFQREFNSQARKLPPVCRAVLDCIIKNSDNETGISTISQEFIVEFTGYKRRQVQYALKILHDWGFVFKGRRCKFINGMFENYTNEYCVNYAGIVKRYLSKAANSTDAHTDCAQSTDKDISTSKEINTALKSNEIKEMLIVKMEETVQAISKRLDPEEILPITMMNPTGEAKKLIDKHFSVLEKLECLEDMLAYLNYEKKITHLKRKEFNGWCIFWVNKTLVMKAKRGNRFWRYSKRLEHRLWKAKQNQPKKVEEKVYTHLQFVDSKKWDQERLERMATWN